MKRAQGSSRIEPSEIACAAIIVIFIVVFGIAAAFEALPGLGR